MCESRLANLSARLPTVANIALSKTGWARSGRSLGGGDPLVANRNESGDGVRGLSTPCPQRLFGSKGIGAMDKAWTTPSALCGARTRVAPTAHRRQGLALTVGPKTTGSLKVESARTDPNRNIALFIRAEAGRDIRGRGCPAQILWRLGPVGRAVPPAQVEKGDVLFTGRLGLGRRFAVEKYC